MVEKKLTIRVDETIYEVFKALCEANGFKPNSIIVDAISEPNAFIEAAIARRDEVERAKKAAQIVQLKNELGLTDADLRKLLKDSEQSATSTAKATEVIESHQNNVYNQALFLMCWRHSEGSKGYALCEMEYMRMEACLNLRHIPTELLICATNQPAS